MEAEAWPLGPKDKVQSNVTRVYRQLKEMAIQYEFRPGDRLHEVELAAQLNTSRTPLREALNRLATEGFLIFTDKPGFYCRPLSANDVCDLYECRIAIERQAVRMATERASDADLEKLWDFVPRGDDSYRLSADQLLQQDERFHQRVVELSGNKELARFLDNIHDRIRFVRSIKRKSEAETEHHAIISAMVKRDAAKAEALLEAHIHHRRGDIVEAIRIGVARIYMRGVED